MFTGIIETVGEIKNITKDGGNLHIEVKSSITPELKIDQSVSHNGVCLTVVEVRKETYVVTAIGETLEKTSFKSLQKGHYLNLERAMKLGDRLDGHIVQGHVDGTAVCKEINETDGSWYFTFEYNDTENTTVEKGSVTVNGVSLTVVNSKENEFSVALIPYTYLHTNFNKLKIGNEVNVEFDIIGKYLKKLTMPYL